MLLTFKAKQSKLSASQVLQFYVCDYLSLAMCKKVTLIYFFVLLCSVPSAKFAFACDSIGGLQDVNCDGKFRIAVLGDSIGRGNRGNLRAKGSFVKRIGKSLRFASIKNLSIPGLDTKRAIKYLKKDFPKNDYGVKKSFLKNADFVLIELGINDYFSTSDPKDTVDRLKEIVSLVESYVTSNGGTPVIALTRITPVRPITENRAAQASFTAMLNDELKAESSAAFPAYVEFDTIPETDVLASDGIHPDTNGHDLMTKILRTYIKATLGA